MNKELKAFGFRVAVIRGLRKMKPIELARASGLSKGHVSQIESGERNVCLSTIYSLAKALRVEPSAFFVQP